MSDNRGEFKLYLFWGIVFFLIGVALIVVPTFFPDLIASDTWYKILLYSGFVLALVGLLFCLATASIKVKNKQSQDDDYEEEEPVYEEDYDEYTVPEPEPHEQYYPEPETVPQPVPENIQYFPSEDAYDLINLGPRQSIEEKFNEIAKMDRTQFVVYIAKLFSLKGYQVKYTPVIDNYDIDLIVEKMDVVIAVGCILTSKILSDTDIRRVAEGRRRYNVNNVMALTNMYFDRTALNFAKQEKMSLVDRNILAEDFML